MQTLCWEILPKWTDASIRRKESVKRLEGFQPSNKLVVKWGVFSLLEQYLADGCRLASCLFWHGLDTSECDTSESISAHMFDCNVGDRCTCQWVTQCVSLTSYLRLSHQTLHFSLFPPDPTLGFQQY
jgi:hypothetical protein